jgi:hypothetical protein
MITQGLRTHIARGATITTTEGNRAFLTKLAATPHAIEPDALARTLIPRSSRSLREVGVQRPSPSRDRRNQPGRSPDGQASTSSPMAARTAAASPSIRNSTAIAPAISSTLPCTS